MKCTVHDKNSFHSKFSLVENRSYVWETVPYSTILPNPNGIGKQMRNHKVTLTTTYAC